MKYCTKCGSELFDDASFCPKCGCATDNTKSSGMDFIKSFNLANEEARSKENNKVPKALACLCIIVAVLGSFLPFMKVSVLGSVSNVSLWDENFIVLTIIGLIILMVDLIEILTHHDHMGRDTVVMGIVFAVETIFQYTYNKSRLSSVEVYGSKYDMSSLLSPGVGFYVILVAAVGLIISGFWLAKINE